MTKGKTYELFSSRMEIALIAEHITLGTRNGQTLKQLAKNATETDREKLYRVARWLGYNVQKRNGEWREIVKL